MKFLVSLLVLLSLTISSASQEPTPADISPFVVVEAMFPGENGGGAQRGYGRGVVVDQDDDFFYLQHLKTGEKVTVSSDVASSLVRTWVLTAGHVVDKSTGGRIVEFQNGLRTQFAVVKEADYGSRDVALLICWAPKSLNPVPICPTDPKVGDVVQAVLPRSSGIIRVDSRIDVINNGNIYLSMALTSGDSGSPIVSQCGVVGIVSGGWFWFDGEVVGGLRRTYPLRAGIARLRTALSVAPIIIVPQSNCPNGQCPLR